MMQVTEEVTEVIMEALMEAVTPQATVTAVVRLLMGQTITQAAAATLEATAAAMVLEMDLETDLEMAMAALATMVLETAPETEAVLQTLRPVLKILATELLPLPSSQWARWLLPKTLSQSSFMDLQLSSSEDLQLRWEATLCHCLLQVLRLSSTGPLN